MLIPNPAMLQEYNVKSAESCCAQSRPPIKAPQQSLFQCLDVQTMWLVEKPPQIMLLPTKTDTWLVGIVLLEMQHN